MKISYAITVCNEFIEIQRLLSFLLTHKRKKDSIVILYDEAHGDPKIEEYLRANSINGEFIWHKDDWMHIFEYNEMYGIDNGEYNYYNNDD